MKSSAVGDWTKDNARLLHRIQEVGLHLLVLVVVAVVIFPMYWMLVSSFKSKDALYDYPPTLVPSTWTLENYRDLFSLTSFSIYFRNSVVVALGTTLLSLIVGSLGAYSLSRFRYAGISLFARLTLVIYMLPSVLIVLPLYVYIVRFGMADRLSTLVIANTTFTLPFTLWLMRSYFNAIPISLEESALIDGSTRLRALRDITLPIALPGLVSVGIFAFTHAWNEFLFALVFLSSEKNKTLPVGLATWIGQDNIFSWGMLLAGSVLVTLPVMVFYLFVQRSLISGMAEGGMKE